jgi:hypothetical protein
MLIDPLIANMERRRSYSILLVIILTLCLSGVQALSPMEAASQDTTCCVPTYIARQLTVTAGQRKSLTGPKTRVLVRVQAKGGKYLGDDIGGSWVTVRNSQTGELLASGVTSGDSGSVSDSYVPNASSRVIVTPGSPPRIHWLVAGPNSSRFSAEIALERPAMLEVTAFGAIGGLQTAHRAVATQWAVPGNDVEIGVEISGLLVQVMDPPTHMQLPSSASTVPLKAKVAMMCGCPINTGMPWIPSDFHVTAHVRNLGSGAVAIVPLMFSQSDVPGLYEGIYNVTEPGFYDVTILAVQRSTGNTGAGQVTFFR